MLAACGGHQASKEAAKDLASIMTPKQQKEAELRLSEVHIEANAGGVVVEKTLPSQTWKR